MTIFNNIQQRTRWTKYHAWVNSKDFVMLHHTGHTSNATLDNMCSYLATNNAWLASCHYVVWTEKDPRIVQLYNQDRITRHAWESSYKWLTDFNRRSIGIEIFGKAYWENNRRNVDFDDWQREAVRDLVNMLLIDNDLTPDKIITHADVAGFRWKRDVADNFWNTEYATFKDYQNSFITPVEPIIPTAYVYEWLELAYIENLQRVTNLMVPMRSALWDEIEDPILRDKLNKINIPARDLLAYLNTIV